VTQRTRVDREGRVQNEPEKVRIARTRADLLQKRREIETLPPDAEGRAEALQLINDTLAGIPETDGAPKFGEKVEGKSFELFNKPYSQLTPAERKSVNDAIRVEGEKADKAPAYGTDREATAQELYEKNFSQLSKTEKAAVNDLVEKRQGTRAEKGAPKTATPGEGRGGAKDIAAFRNEVITAVRPYRDAVIAADTALVTAKEALASGNYTAYDVARRQLLKAAGESQISNADIKGAGADPSLVGGTIDYIKTKLQGMPTEESQKKLTNTLLVLKKLAQKKGQQELKVQKDIGSRAKYTTDDLNLIFNFPEFEQRAGGGGKTTTRTLKSGKTVTITED
jgi:hypothetical protein